MTVNTERQLISKILTIIAEIQGSLTQVGISYNEIKTYFAIRIFKSGKVGEKDGEESVGLEKQIAIFLQKEKKEGKLVREVLIKLLATLEMEKEQIEEFQNFQPEDEPALVLSKRKSSASSISEAPPLRSQRSSSIWQRFTDNDSIQEPKMSPKLNQLISFERDLHESLMKTKMLKHIIQKRLMSEMEDTCSSRVKHIHELLALES